MQTYPIHLTQETFEDLLKSLLPDHVAFNFNECNLGEVWMQVTILHKNQTTSQQWRKMSWTSALSYTWLTV